MESLSGFEGVDAVAVVVLGRDHFEILHHGVDMVGPVPVEGHGYAVFDGIVRMVFDLETSHFLFPERDPYLPLSLERDGVPLLLCGSEHVRMLRGHVRREKILHGFPTLALNDNVVQGFHNIFEKVVRETTERVCVTMQRVSLLRIFL